MSDEDKYQFQMLTIERLADFEKLFGKSCAFGDAGAGGGSKLLANSRPVIMRNVLAP